MTNEELNKLITTGESERLEFNTSWDYHLNNQFSLDDISFEKVRQAIDIINRAGTRITEDPLTFLLKNDLVRNGNIRSRPSVRSLQI